MKGVSSKLYGIKIWGVINLKAKIFNLKAKILIRVRELYAIRVKNIKRL